MPASLILLLLKLTKGMVRCMCKRCKQEKICFVDYIKQNRQFYKQTKNKKRDKKDKKDKKDKEDDNKELIYVCSYCGARYLCKRNKNHKRRDIVYNIGLIIYGVCLLYGIREIKIKYGYSLLLIVLVFTIYYALLAIYMLFIAYTEWKCTEWKLLEVNPDIRDK